jgi:hypothetical protein
VRGCGSDLTLAPVVGVEARHRQVFDLPEVRLRATEHRAERRLCGYVTAAGFPAQARAAACYGAGVRALAVYLGVWQHLPVERAAGLLADAHAGICAGGRRQRRSLPRSGPTGPSAVRGPMVGAGQQRTAADM